MGAKPDVHRLLGPFELLRRLPLHAPLRSLEFWEAKRRDDGEAAIVASPQAGLESLGIYGAWAAAFEADVEAAARLDHDAVLRVVDRGRAGLVPFAAFEPRLCVTIREVWNDRPGRDRLPPLVAATIVERIAAALDHVAVTARERESSPSIGYVDEGVVLCTEDGEVKLLPTFANVFEVEMPSLVEPPRLLGLPPTDRQPSIRSVVFSLGTTLYQLAAGRLPLGDDAWPELTRLTERFPRPSETDPALVVLDEIVARSTRADPARRYADPGQMAAALGQLVQGGADVPDVGYRDVPWSVGRTRTYLAERVATALGGQAV